MKELQFKRCLHRNAPLFVHLNAIRALMLWQHDNCAYNTYVALMCVSLMKSHIISGTALISSPALSQHVGALLCNYAFCLSGVGWWWWQLERVCV